MAEERKYLDYDGLAHLVELLTNRIQAVGGDGKFLPLTGGTLTGDLTVETKLTANQAVVADDLTAYAIGAGASLDCGGSVSFTALPDSDPSSEAGVLTVGSSGTVSKASMAGLASALGATAPGVYAAYVDSETLINGVCDPSDWDGGGRAFCGGLIVGSGWNILVAPDWSSGRAYSSSNNVDVSYCTDGELEAAGDFDGRGNTTAGLDAGNGSGSSCGLYYANTYSLGSVGAGKWWVPSCGELMEVMRNWDALQGLFDAVYPTRITAMFSRLWSSTAHGTSMNSWTVGTDGSLSWENRVGNGDYVYPTLPVSTFRW